MIHWRDYFKSDLLAGLVVFLVAVPLCLGIALASGVPLFSGLIAGIIGGILVGYLSQSQVSVSGPAAGLVAIVLAGVASIGTLEGFFLAVFLAGFIQLILSLVKAGGIAYYFPSNVIKGMLTAIGIIIIMKQLPHFIGYDKDYEGDLSFFEKEGHNTISSMLDALTHIHFGVAIAGMISLLAMFFWDKLKPAKLKLIPGALVSVVVGLLCNELFKLTGIQEFIIKQEHLVQLPIIQSFTELSGSFIFPDFGMITSPKVWTVAFTLGLVASIETLLTLEATDKLDPLRRVSPTNRELFAQGIGNIFSGLLGGLPITSVIVRSSANINSGGRFKTSTIFHGVLLLIGGLFLARFLNYIPLTALAAILLITGFKLANPKIFIEFIKKSPFEYLPFFVTVVSIVFTDLLTGIAIGTGVSICALLMANIKNVSFFSREKVNNETYLSIVLSEEVSFLNKAAIRLVLDRIKEGTKVIIDASKSFYIDSDVREIIQEFVEIKAKERNIEVLLKGFKASYGLENTYDQTINEY